MKLSAAATDGVVTLANVIPHAVLDAAAAKLDYDAARMILHGHGVESGRGASGESDETFGGVGGRHLEVGLPRNAEYSFPEMLSNPIIEQCVRRFLGPAYCRYWCGNTACPGSGVQPLHADGGGWSVKSKVEADKAGGEWPHPPYMLSVNFGVDDMTPENGSTEVSEPAPVAERHSSHPVIFLLARPHQNDDVRPASDELLGMAWVASC